MGRQSRDCPGPLARAAPSDQEPPEALEEVITYLENQQAWIGNYEQWRAAGYPVGSGMPRTGPGSVINCRLIRRAMRWLRVNARAIVAQWVRILNADWEAASAKRRAVA